LVGGSFRRPENGEKISESGGDISKPTSKRKKRSFGFKALLKKGDKNIALNRLLRSCFICMMHCL
jgi:hypothetical protein